MLYEDVQFLLQVIKTIIVLTTYFYDVNVNPRLVTRKKFKKRTRITFHCISQYILHIYEFITSTNIMLWKFFSICKKNIRLSPYFGRFQFIEKLRIQRNYNTEFIVSLKSRLYSPQVVYFITSLNICSNLIQICCKHARFFFLL